MSITNILNASVEAVGSNLIENCSNILDVSLKRNETDHSPNFYRSIGLSLLSNFSLLFVFVYLWSYVELAKCSKKRESWYCIYHWLLVSFLNVMFGILTVLNLMYYVCCKNGELWKVKLGRRYLLTLHAYTLVALALYTYNLVFKTFFRYPLSRMQWYMILVGLYFISSFTTLYFTCVYGWAENLDSGLGYLTYTWQFAQYPGTYNMTVLLMCNYIVPACIVIFLLGRVGIELMKRQEFFIFNEQKTYSLCIGDRKCIAIAFCTCLGFVVTSIPFIIHEIVRIFRNPNLIDQNGAECLEIMSIFNLYLDPCFVLMFEFRHSLIRYKAGNLESKWAWDDNEVVTGSHEQASIEFVKGESEENRNDSPNDKKGKISLEKE
ncbi:uncharacterized protein NPIL_430761 [Nephila pilipes]|uniref:Uncharacterized protein n=1 Tax=Nephila pilipes TaxID=299642 RepID=A0A8X6QR90_NEPPI|nr:uncharacterized protein NPIL_430761 [Nephila pilipes]